MANTALELALTIAPLVLAVVVPIWISGAIVLRAMRRAVRQPFVPPPAPKVVPASSLAGIRGAGSLV